MLGCGKKCDIAMEEYGQQEVNSPDMNQNFEENPLQIYRVKYIDDVPWCYCISASMCNVAQTSKLQAE